MRRSFMIAALTGVVAVAGCSSTSATQSAASSSAAPGVPMVNASGEVIGEVQARDGDNGATLLIMARGLPPGVHGIHIHDVGACDPPDFKSAGPHWNPTGKQHGAENPQGAHMGDLQNVTVAQDGQLKAEILVPNAHLSDAGGNAMAGGQILDANGAAVVIHADPDDYKTDPSGNSGARIACAVLGGQ